jgi:hypothetical protein
METKAKKQYILFFMILFTSIVAFGQKEIFAARMDEEMTIDGKLDEGAWNQASVAEDFTNWTPNPGVKPTFQTEVKIMYDDEALYLGAILHVNNKDSIARELTQRDDIGNTDWFGLVIDTYGNGSDGWEFIVGATGVQFDAKFTDDQGEDTNWDAVWFSSIEIKEDHWIAEVKIPYSALRFANKPEQSWRINFMRSINGLQEKSSWNPYDPTTNGFLTQAGKVSGLKNITPPVRLSVSPYLSVYAQNYQEGDNSSSGYSYNGGMDLKYGITDAFTLDMTLIPDFGQVRSDDVVLNLSPFEVRYDENRQFFTEGLELFDQQDLFYSRRVGGTPIGYYSVNGEMHEGETVINNNSTTQLYNASKISGRNSNGLGIGVFNAISRETHAILENNETRERRSLITSPLTNYNIVVLDQNLANNSSATFMNTNVWRAGDLYHDANVSSLKFDLKNKSQTYAIFGRGVLSQILNPSSDNVLGHTAEIGVAKISGNYAFNFSYEESSQNFNPNDLGFLGRNNYRRLSLFASHSKYKAFGPFNRGNFWANINYERQIVPNSFSYLHFNTGFWMQTKSFWSFNMWANFRPESNDFNEPRRSGRHYRMPRRFNVGYWMESDNRKAFHVSGYVDFQKVAEEGRYSMAHLIEPRFRFSNQFSLGSELEIVNSYSEKGFVDNVNDQIIFGNRDRNTIINSLRAIYTINDKMGLDFRLRHYWSTVHYDQFYDLQSDGRVTSNKYNASKDFSFNAFNIDLNYRWRFSPGSDLIINWKNNISGSSQDLISDYSSLSYKDGLDQLNTLPQTNSVSLRVVYYLDYLSLKKVL